MGNIFHRCRAYEDFEKVIESIESNYLGLNPIDGDLLQHVGINDGELDERGSEFVRAGIVTAMSAWDVYVHSLFHEAFNFFLFRANADFENLQKMWPACNMIIENEKRLQQEGSRMSEAATQLDEDREKLLSAYRDRVLHQRALLPVFDCASTCRWPGITIDELFQQLFKAERNLSEILIEVCGNNDYYGIRTNNSCTYLVMLKSDPPSDRSAVETLCAISFVHYLLRCLLVNDKSFEIVDFRYEIVLSNRNHSDVKAYYDLIRENVIKFNGHDVRVNYLTLLNVTRYLRFVALSLMRAVAQWFYDLQTELNEEEKFCIWKYPKDESNDDSCVIL